MNLPEIFDHEEEARDIVAGIINKAHEKLGRRLSLSEIAETRQLLSPHAFFNSTTIQPPLVINGEKFLRDAIERTWKLTRWFQYHFKDLGGSNDYHSHYHYFEVIFSQPTESCPIPQTTCSVFFTIEHNQKIIGRPSETKESPTVTFRIEGHHTDHDVRYTRLIPDWIMAVMMMKLKLFRRIEKLNVF